MDGSTVNFFELRKSNGLLVFCFHLNSEIGKLPTLITISAIIGMDTSTLVPTKIG